MHACTLCADDISICAELRLVLNHLGNVFQEFLQLLNSLFHVCRLNRFLHCLTLGGISCGSVWGWDELGSRVSNRDFIRTSTPKTGLTGLLFILLSLLRPDSGHEIGTLVQHGALDLHPAQPARLFLEWRCGKHVFPPCPTAKTLVSD